jgi:hypothetical protein
VAPPPWWRVTLPTRLPPPPPPRAGDREAQHTLTVDVTQPSMEYRTLFQLPLATAWLLSDSRMRITATIVRNAHVAVDQIEIIENVENVENVKNLQDTNATNTGGRVLDVVVAVRCNTANKSILITDALQPIVSNQTLVSLLFGVSLRGAPRMHQHTLVHRSTFGRTGYQKRSNVPPSVASANCQAAHNGCAVDPPSPTAPQSETSGWVYVLIAVAFVLVGIVGSVICLRFQWFGLPCNQAAQIDAAPATETATAAAPNIVFRFANLANAQAQRLCAITHIPSVVYMSLSQNDSSDVES